jgi:hypothetical protein
MSNLNTQDSGTQDHTNQNDQGKEQNTPDLEQLIESKLNQQLKKKQREDNVATVDSELKKTYGDKFKEVVDKEASRLGLGKEFLRVLAEEQPRAYLKLLVPTRQDVDLTLPPRTEVNTTFTPNTTGRTKEYYTELRKTKPALYWDPKTQMQLHEDAKSWGGY